MRRTQQSREKSYVSPCKLTVGEKARDGQFARFSSANFRLIAKEERGWKHMKSLSLLFFLSFFLFSRSSVQR